LRYKHPRCGFTLIEVLVSIAIMAVLAGLLLPAVQQVRETARKMDCLSHLRQIGLGVHQYYEQYQGRFFLHHPYDADVNINATSVDSFAEIFWEDKLMPFIGGLPEANEQLAQQGIRVASEAIYRCQSDTSIREPYIDNGQVLGIQHRSSYLMNSLLSHKSRRYGYWTFARFSSEVGTSNFVAFSERDATAFGPGSGNDPRQDDYDIWLGTDTIADWIASERHNGAANVLYLDGHAATLRWDAAVIDMYPDKVVLEQDGSYPF
jgi:prepilin-type N-terminal cleavage/methylation domain-containing protein/prepilin-type processing-associated H-X9-DG protein